MSGEILFYSLLYIDRERNRHANLDALHVDPVEVYVACAALSAMSARAHGIKLGVITNEPELVAARLRALDLDDVPVVSIEFSLAVPKTKIFYSAHFKIDVIAALGTGRFGSRVGLVDVDTVFCNQIPDVLLELPPSSLAAYDVSRPDNPLHTGRGMLRDLAIVAGQPLRQPRWFGGEFLLGDAVAFAQLREVVGQCWPRYVRNIGRMFHVGDETPVSTALNLMSDAGFPVVDVGVTPSVIRWWSGGARHPQPAFDEIQNHLLLHLPFDKAFLAEQARIPFSKVRFLAAYRRRLEVNAGRKRFRDHFRRWIPVRIDASGEPASEVGRADPDRAGSMRSCDVA